MKPRSIVFDANALKEAATRPDVIQGFLEMGKELEKTPEFVAEMTARLDRVINGDRSKEDN